MPRFQSSPIEEEGAVKSNPSEECMEIPFSTCVGNKIILPQAESKALIGHWTFDDAHGRDSVTGSLMDPPPAAGFSRGGVGQSAHFNGKSYATVEHNSNYETNEFTVMFWMYLLRGDKGNFRTILDKGNSPTIQFWPEYRTLHAKVAIGDGDDKLVKLDSVAVIPLQRWTHVALLVQGKLIQFYINGILDSQTVAPSNARFNRDALLVGGHPDHLGTACFMDSLKFFRVGLPEAEIQSEAAGALGSIAASFVKLGCTSCSVFEAGKSCMANAVGSGYHVCSRYELGSAGVSVARAQGWLAHHQGFPSEAVEQAGVNDMRFWSYEAWNTKEELPKEERRLTLCCKGD